MTIAYLTGAHANAESTATTSAIDTTGATLLVAAACRSNTGGTMSDSKGNTWTALTTFQSGASAPFITPYYCVNPTVGSGHTFSYTTSTLFPALAVIAFSGAGAFDSGQTGSNELFPVTSVQAGSLTPAHDNNVVISAWGLVADPGSVPTINGGFTIDQHQTFTPGVTISIAHLIQTSAAASNPTWSWTNSHEPVTTQFTFVAAGSSGTLAAVDGIVIANISKCQGIAKASLLSYNGLTF